MRRLGAGSVFVLAASESGGEGVNLSGGADLTEVTVACSASCPESLKLRVDVSKLG